MAIIGTFSTDSSPSPATPKASSPSKSPSSSSSVVASPKSSEAPKSSSSSTSTKIHKSNSPSFSSSNSDGGAPNSSPSGSPSSSSFSLGPSKSNNQKTKKGSSHDSKSPKEVSFPPLPTIINELFDSLSHSPKSKDVDSENLRYSEDSLTPALSNVDVIKATSAIGVAIVVRFFLF
ncbi:hypothetical protein V6N13_065344 [Hibiscus sabdariffa]|uniref:Uncharacterized protein n=1 Tax=Hibiscus sabdariffa TaxID=183260 RepID=A0ABR2QR73_9ROSI